jgi:outer membrane protein assembly factor BamB
MPETLAPVDHQIAKRCPACGRVSADSARCLHCWRDIAAVPPLPAEEAAEALKVEASLARRVDAGRFSSGRLWRYGLLAVLVLLVGWWVYSTFIDKPPKPDAASGTRAAAAGFWTTQDGENRGTRASTSPALLSGTEAWKASLGSPAATPLVTDGRLVVAALQDGRVVGLEAASGKTLWTATLDNAPFSAPVIAGDRVYLAKREGVVLVLNASDGTEAWHSRFVAGSFEASPLVADGVVYAYSTEGLFAFDSENGRILWESLFDASWATVTPVLEGKYLAVATAERAIVFDRTNGQQTYYVTFSRSQPTSLALIDGHVIAVYGRNASVFSTASRTPWWEGFRAAWFRFHLIGMAPKVPPVPTLWDVTTLPRTTLAAAVAPKVVVITSPEGAVTALGRADGKPAWTAQTGPLVTAPMVTADGALFVEGGRLVLLDLATGQQKAERKVDGLRFATPAGGANYLALGSGEVIALR